MDENTDTPAGEPNDPDKWYSRGGETDLDGNKVTKEDKGITIQPKGFLAETFDNFNIQDLNPFAASVVEAEELSDEDLKFFQSSPVPETSKKPPPTPTATLTPDDPQLRNALAKVESNMNPRAIGPKTKYGTAKGAHQFIDSTWDQYGEGGDVFNPEHSDKAAHKYLNTLYKKYDGDIKLTLAGYNWGEGNLDKAIDKAGTSDYAEVAPHMPLETQNYVPKVLGAYNKTSPKLAQLIENTKFIDNKKAPGIIDNKGFSKQMLPIVSSPEYQSLSALDKITIFNKVYQKNIYDPEVKETLKKLSSDIWIGASPEESEALRAEFGTPDRAKILAQKTNPDAYLEEWKAAKLKEIEDMGIAPELLDKPFNAHFSTIKKDEDEAYSIRSKGAIGRFAAILGARAKDAIKGGADLPVGAAAGIANMLGANALASEIVKLPDELLGPNSRIGQYDWNKDGYLILNEDGTPRQQWEVNAFRVAANGLSSIGVGTGLKVAGVGASTIHKTLFGANALMIGNQTFNSVYQATGDKEKAYIAAFLSIPAAEIGTLMQMSILSGYASKSLVGLSRFNQLKVFAKESAKGAIKGGIGITGQDIALQGTEISQTGQPFSVERMTEAAALGAATGAISGPLVAGLERSQKLATENKVKTLVNENLQHFQDSHESERVLNVAKEFVNPDVVDSLGMTSVSSENGRTTFTKKNFIPEEAATPAEAANNTLKYLTPDEIHDLSHERGELLAKARTGKLNEKEIDRVNILDNKLKGTEDPAYINKIRANEKEYLALSKETGETPLPLEWNAEKGVFRNTTNDYEHPFMKGALGQEEFSLPSKDPASTTIPQQQFLPVSPSQIGELPPEFVQLPAFKPTNETPMTPRKVVRKIIEAGRVAAKSAGFPEFAIKEGGRFSKGELGLAYLGARSIRTRSLRDIPTVLHEVTHAVDTDLNDITLKSAKVDPKLAEALIQQAIAFYPSKSVRKNPVMAVREGLTMFLQNKLTRQPVHRDLLEWWDGRFKDAHPELHAAYEKVGELADAYYSQTLEARTQSKLMSDEPGRTEKFLAAATDIKTWQAMADKDFVFRELDKALGHKGGRYDSKSYRGFIDALDNSTTLVADNLVQGDVYTDLSGNIVPGMKTYKQIFEGLPKEQQEAVKLYIDMKQALVMHDRKQASPFPQEDVEANLARLTLDPNQKKFLELKAEEWYSWIGKTLDMLSADSPSMRAERHRVKKANLRDTEHEHGYYVPMERQDKPSGLASSKGGTLRTPEPTGRRTGSDRPLKPMEERVGNLIQNWTNASLHRRLIDRLILDNQMGRGTGGMLQKITPRQALKFQTTYEDMLNRASKAFKQSIGITGEEQLLKATAGMAVESGAPIEDVLGTMFQWWVPETSMKGDQAANGYMILADKLPNGKFNFYEVHPALPEAFARRDRSNEPAYITAARFGKRLVQVSATTINPVFQARNFLVRDPQASLLLAEGFHPMSLAKNMFAELYDQLVTKTTGRQVGVYALAQRMGLGSATYLGAAKEINYVASKRGISASIWKAGDKAISLVEFVSSLGENATRLAYMRMKAESLGLDLFDPKTKITPLQAIELSLAFKNSTVNFSKRGNNKTINQLADIIPFFGARLAATSQTIEAAAESPGRAIAFATAAFSAGIAAYLYNAGKDWYDELSAETKATAFTLDLGKQPDGRSRMIAIPFDNFNGVFYGLGQAAAKQFHENPNSDIEASTGEMIKEVMQQMSPIDLPLDESGTVSTLMSGFGPVGKTITEILLNKDTHRNKPIVDKRKPPTEQFTENTSELMKEVGRITGMSPDKIEYFVRSIGSGPLTIEKFFEKQTGVKPVNEQEGINFILRAFTRSASNAAIQDQSRSKFYEAQAQASIEKSNETQEQQDSRRFIDRVAKKVTDINKEIAATEDKTKRDELFAYRRELFRAGVRSRTTPGIEMPTLEEKTDSQESE